MMRTTLAILVLVIAAGAAACGDGHQPELVCQRAIELWNGCADADRQDVFGVPKLQWNGPCTDGAEFVDGSGSRYTVDLETWSRAYTECHARGDVMPFTCMCPGLAFVTPSYTPPESCSEFTPAGVADFCAQYNDNH